ncbi:FkbM family methyltransferase [Ohtaekwangia kribbensis]|uniref:FkbM family methyltransferase n=1 Tax=Ohtaekwangia kribbensis TaxID=688913 RepID=A0ABW3K542_9BACT
MRPGTTDRQVFREVFLFKEYNFPLTQNPSIVVDAGANIGLATVFFKNRFPEALVYAIEPDSKNFTVLTQNAKAYEGTYPMHSALWRVDSYLRIKDKNENAWAFQVEECNQEDPDSFSAISIETLMRSNGIERIDLLKLDIEGAERDVFASNYDYWLPRTKVIIIELHDWMKEGCSREFFRAIINYRFRVSIYAGMLLLYNIDLD